MSLFQFPAREYKKKFKLLIPLPLIAQFTISPCSHFQTTAQIRNQLGQGPDPAPLDRGILQLEKKPSWIADASDLPPVEPSFVISRTCKAQLEVHLEWPGIIPPSCGKPSRRVSRLLNSLNSSPRIHANLAGTGGGKHRRLYSFCFAVHYYCVVKQGIL
jgi:hypothetical protein